jgi:hypothetical protein
MPSNASFNFSDNIIHAEGVRFINVGDAALIPYDGKVTIREKAEIEKLNYARLVAGRENKYHELYNVIATINSGADFRGSGDYDYIDENQTIQKIHFDTCGIIRKLKELLKFRWRLILNSVPNWLQRESRIEQPISIP